MSKDLRIKSNAFDGTMRAPNRAMLRAVGVSDEDFKKHVFKVEVTNKDNKSIFIENKLSDVIATLKELDKKRLRTLSSRRRGAAEGWYEYCSFLSGSHALDGPAENH